MVEKGLITVRVRRPGKNEFFRVHPDPAYVCDSVILETMDGLDRITYWVAPALRAELYANGDAIQARLFTCVSKRGGATFLWPAKLPQDGAGRRWHETALEIAELAKSNWIKMKGDRDEGAYVPYTALGNLSAPVWRAEPFSELVKIAFKGKVIDSDDHDVLRQLRGEL